MTDPFQTIAQQLAARGALVEAQQLHQITGSEAPIPPKVVEAIRLLHVVQAEAVKDPGLVQIAARASLLGHQIELFYIRGKGALP